MKKVEAIIKKFKLDEVINALSGIGISGMAISEIQGCGRERMLERATGERSVISFDPLLKIEIVMKDELVKQAVETIKTIAKTGRIGDGIIFVYSIEEAVRIRTGEEGEDAV